MISGQDYLRSHITASHPELLGEADDLARHMACISTHRQLDIVQIVDWIYGRPHFNIFDFSDWARARKAEGAT